MKRILYSLWRSGASNLRAPLRLAGLGSASMALYGLSKSERVPKDFRFAKFLEGFVNKDFEEIFKGTQIKDISELLDNEESIKQLGDSRMIILVNPGNFNSNFLKELRQLTDRVYNQDEGIDIYYLNESQLGAKELASLAKITDGNIEHDSLILLKEDYDSKFSVISFGEYFRNNQIANKYFEKIKKMDSSKTEKFLSYVENHMDDSQLFVIGYCSKSGEKNRDHIKTLSSLKVGTFLDDGYRYGVNEGDTDLGIFGDVEEGDLLLIQKFGKEKFLESKNSKIIGDMLITRLPGVLDGSKGEIMEAIGESLHATNLYFPAPALSNKNCSYLIKVNYDANSVTGEELVRMRDTLKQLRSSLEKDYSALSANTLITLNPTSLQWDEKWHMVVQDVKRADLKSM